MTLTLKAARRLLPRRPAESHKGTFGHVLVVAGSRDMAGASGLAGLGALRSGAGLVTLAVPRSRQNVAAAVAAEALTVGLPEAKGSLAPAAVAVVEKLLKNKKFSAFALGPGLTTAPGTIRAVKGLVRVTKQLPVVIDADALNGLSSLHSKEAAALLKARAIPAVLTPHPGELSRLLKKSIKEIQADRPAAATEAARRFGVVCLLKGHRTVVADGKSVSVNPTGNPGMARGGMGDVLTGLIGGFLAQGLAPFDAARLGAYAHGLAGDIAARKVGRVALLPRDLAAALPQALRRIENA